MQQIFCLLILLISIIQPVQAVENGRWLLTITGLDKVEFGTEHLAGGLNIKWKTVLEFVIKNNRFKQGTGKAVLEEEITSFSRPVDMFDCQLVNGVFSSRSGMSFSTPHLRYKAFPISGKVVGDAVQLNPYLDYPGNYFAVLYQCKTDNELGSFWIEHSPRISRELSKRQNVITKIEEGIYRADIKEVKNIAPGPQIELPFTDGLKFSVTDEYGLRKLQYSLIRISDH